MKKQLVTVGIIVLLVCVGLSGCNERTTSFSSFYNAQDGDTVTIDGYVGLILGTSFLGNPLNYTSTLTNKALEKTGEIYHQKGGTELIYLTFPDGFNFEPNYSLKWCRVTGEKSNDKLYVKSCELI